MGLNPKVARYVPNTLCRFCEGLRFPHAFIILLPTFMVGLMFAYYLPHAEEILTTLGLAMFFTSKARL